MNRATKRILIDYAEIMKDPVEHIHYANDEENIFKGYALIVGPKDTPYHNGLFEFHAYFPNEYPGIVPQVLINTTDNGKVRSTGYLLEYIKQAPYLNTDLDYRPADLKYNWPAE